MRVIAFVLLSSVALSGCLAGAAIGAAGAVVGTTANVAVKTTGAVIGAVTPDGDDKDKQKGKDPRQH
jgi:hypothetical protein